MNEELPTAEPHQDKQARHEVSPLLICLVLTVLMAIGIFWGNRVQSVLLTTIFLLPVVGYEVYRTRGAYTTFASWALLVVLVLEIILLVFKVNYDLGQYLGISYTYIGGSEVPLGDIKILGPTLMVVFSLILLFRTAGPYTKWLSIIIIISAFFLVQMMNPEIFKSLIRSGVERLTWYL